MKTISLRQPWAALLINGIKTWETRAWRPGPLNRKIIERDGLLIHASATKRDAWRMGVAPFSNHLGTLGKLNYGVILGRCRVGRIVRTEEWLKEFQPFKGSPCFDEWCFGDFAPGRWAWELLEPEIIETPFPVRGALSLWDYPWTEEEIQAEARRNYGEPYDMEMYASK